MAITIISNLTSGKYYPSANPINVTVYSNNSGNCNFRYVNEIYINNVKVFTQKLFPDPTTGYAFFQLSRIVQDYVETTMFKVPQSTYFAVAGSSITTPSGLISIYCKFGEEYDSTATCDGVVNQYLNLATSNSAYVFESAIDYEDWPTFNSDNYTFALTAKTASFLTNAPREQDVTFNDSYYLDFISTSAMTNTRVIGLETYDYNDQLYGSYLLPSGTLVDVKRYRIAVGPYDLNRIYNDAVINQSVKYYKLSIGKYQSLTYTRLTEYFTFNVKPPKPFQTRIAFIGLKGGIEHFTFYHRNNSRLEIERKTYEKTLQRNYSNVWTYQVGDRGTTQYSMKAKEKHTVSTYCSKENSEWLSEMWISPKVWTYIRPELKEFNFVKTGTKLLLWVKDHGLSVGNQVFLFPDVEDYAINSALQGVWSITAIVDENMIDLGFTTISYPNIVAGCGYLQKKEDWQQLPIAISDNLVELKQRTSLPIEYTLNYDMAYSKNTLR